MDKKAVVERIMRNLDFDLETESAHKTPQEKSASSVKDNSLNLKIRVRKKENERCNQGFITNFLSEPEMVLRKVRLINSNNTIMSFDMLMEAELDEKTSVKSRSTFGSCLGATEDDDGPYSKSGEKLRQQFPLAKNVYDPFRDTTKGEKTFLGQKCKPGGCLDPPFGEDRYAYRPREPEPSRKHDTEKPQKPIKRDKDDKTDIRHTKTPIKEVPLHINVPTIPPNARTPEPIINIYKTESSKNSLIKYRPSNENTAPRTKIPSEVENITYQPDNENEAQGTRIPDEDEDNIMYSPSYEHKQEQTRIRSEDKDSSEGKLRYPVIDKSIIAKRKISKDIDNNLNEPFSEDEYKYPIDHENKKLTPKETTESNKDSIPKIKLSDEKSKYPFSNGKPKTKITPENYENKFFKKRPSIEDKYRQSIDDSMNSFFSPPKGIKRESSQRDSLKRHSNIPITENKPTEHIRPPTSISLDSVPLEQNADPKSIGDTYIKDKVPEQIQSESGKSEPVKSEPVKSESIKSESIKSESVKSESVKSASVKSESVKYESVKSESFKSESVKSESIQSKSVKSEPDQRNIEQQQVLPIIPLPDFMDTSQKDKKDVNKIDSPVATLKEDSTDPKEPVSIVEDDILSSSNNTFENDLTTEHIEEINDEISKTSSPAQFDFESITKETTDMPLEISSSPTNQSTDGVIYEDQLISDFGGKNKEISLDDTIDAQIRPEHFEELKVDNQAIKPDSLTSVEKNSNNVDNDVDLNPQQDLENMLLDQNDSKLTIDNTSDISNKSSTVSEKIEKDSMVKHDEDEIPKMIQSYHKSQITSPIENILHEEAKEKIHAEKIKKDTENIIKSDNENNYLNKDVISEINQSIDSTNNIINDVSNGINSHSIPTQEEIFDKNVINIAPDEEYFPMPLDTHSKSPHKSTQEAIEAPKAKDEPDSNSKTKTLHNKTDLNTVLLDLTFQSYQNDRKERILKTLDSKYEAKRYPNDSIIIIKSQVKLPSEKEHKFVIPIDSEHDMSIEVTKRHKKIKMEEDKAETKPVPILPQADAHNLTTKKEVSTRRELDSKTHSGTNENETVDNRLTNIYEQELVPLQKMIRSLKQEIDCLAAQQTAYKKKVVCLKASTLPPLIHSRKKCSL